MNFALALKDENDELKERVIQLEEMLGVGDFVVRVFGLTPSEMRLLNALIASKWVSKSVGYYCSSLDCRGIEHIKIVDVLICRIRKKLKPYGFVIQTIWGEGWQMSATDRQSILDIIAKESAK